MLSHSMVTDHEQATKRTVYISNLSYKRDRNGLRSLFSQYGDVRNIKIIVEPVTNQSRGMAFVEMKTVDQARQAIEGLNQLIVDGRVAKAAWATPQRSIYHRASVTPEKKDPNRDLRYTEIQMMKKERNEVKRNTAKPKGFVF